ncbi:hypothetical protein AGDE_01117 [Angomonas deanei]|uniref:Uncharacterized protein n=1 Tax=Angomonas deanei TaxID=59799 RepID=A0A7G2C5W9_9TRYP|nr:hypothetical protein AGDE_01117 [Angomonas deanei]CAD2215150.1 hypothetical protein, conserved [Angomonas deanei]|eukprot:EPY42806.1 hypothetical protein AGDE_01117 [Angomonas deanei]
MRAITANSEYEDRLASRSPPGAFRVPVERALPISYEAQCDIRRVTGERRKSSLHLTSGYAPLFTHSSSHGREPSPEEEEHLRFLHPPPENPKTRVQHKLEEKHAFDKKCDPNLKKRMNEPKKYPNLNKKVSRKFVPACTDQPTYAYAAHCQGNSERTHSAKEANNRARWRN